MPRLMVLKLKGNVEFKQGNYTKALDFYEQSLQQVQVLFEEEAVENECDQKDAVRDLISNRSACLIALYRFEDALKDANNAILLQDDYLKGYLRKGDALFGLREFKQALDAFQKAIELEPHNGLLINRIWKCRLFLHHEQEGVEIYQLLSGRDICKASSLFAPINSIIWQVGAIPLRNLIYCIVNKVSREAIIVDACWDIQGILLYAKEHNFKIVAAFITHHHTDHCGGKPQAPFDKYPIRVEGIQTLVDAIPFLKVFVHQEDLDTILKSNPELDPSKITGIQDGFSFELPIKFDDIWVTDQNLKKTNFRAIHTPGHTKGSTCLLMNEKTVFTGDTLFHQSCGRVDFPDSCKHGMFASLKRLLKTLNDDVVVFPGHNYGDFVTCIGNERVNGVLGLSETEFLKRMPG
jgi:glyoxylase-like metal-dependent hydrolase (beta-lactamase superfamily II)